MERDWKPGVLGEKGMNDQGLAPEEPEEGGCEDELLNMNTRRCSEVSMRCL